ncbi:hypothetical protein [Pectinatus sottacetonis]|uniref:hypothetical protein n=1 Tax=Pectinatus sottacetonis TaxID=1002795 RepID=UPI0018C69842|nr:hypothetical protein [Pectinatus sottacetonis]
MAKVDKVMKDHVAAAKKWLGKAETSLDNDNDIRGDLHIMLAEAELKCAKEKRHNTFHPIWVKYVVLLSSIVLFLSAGGYWLWGKSNSYDESKRTPVIATTVNNPAVNKAKKQLASVDPEKKIITNNIAETNFSSHKLQKKEITNVPEEVITTPAANHMNKISRQEKSDYPKVQTQVPSKKMQQLMRTAKKTLQE